MSGILNLSCGDEAEALDEFGVWCTCKITESDHEKWKVSFNGWGAEWDRYITDPKEIRNATSPSRKRMLVKSSSKVNKHLPYTAVYLLLK
jgi:hypothetical protein